jgi:hypothetical protein
VKKTDKKHMPPMPSGAARNQPARAGPRTFASDGAGDLHINLFFLFCAWNRAGNLTTTGTRIQNFLLLPAVIIAVYEPRCYYFRSKHIYSWVTLK